MELRKEQREEKGKGRRRSGKENALIERGMIDCQGARSVARLARIELVLATMHREGEGERDERKEERQEGGTLCWAGIVVGFPRRI